MTVKPGWARKHRNTAKPLPSTREKSHWAPTPEDWRLLLITVLGGLGSIVIGAAIVGAAIGFAKAQHVTDQPSTLMLYPLTVFGVMVFGALGFFWLGWHGLKQGRPVFGWVFIALSVLAGVPGGFAFAVLALALIGTKAGIH